MAGVSLGLGCGAVNPGSLALAGVQIQGALGMWQEAGGKGGAELREGGGVEKEI